MSDWALYSDGSNDVISIASAISVSLGTWQGVFLYEGRVLTPAGTVGIAGTSSSSTVAGPAVTTAGAMVIRSSANITIATSPDGFVIFDEYHVYEFQHDSGGAFRFVRDGSTISSGTYTGAATWTNINQFFRATSAATGRLNAYTKRILFTGVTNAQDWDANLSGGTGSIFPTGSGSNQGTLLNFPTDDSQWIDTATGPTYTLTAEGGSWSYSGGGATIAFNRKLLADGTSWSYDGASVNLAYNRVLSADGGSYSYAGGDATLTYTTAGATYTLNAEGGAWTCAGGDAVLAYNRAMQAHGGSYQYYGGSASLIFHRVLTASGSLWSYYLSDAQLIMNRVLVASGATYAYSGGSASLTYSGSVILQINGYTVSYGDSTIFAAFGTLPVSAAYDDNLVRAEYGNV